MCPGSSAQPLTKHPPPVLLELHGVQLFFLLMGVSLLSMLAAVALVAWWAVPRLERMFLFRPGRDIYQTPGEVGLSYRELFIETPDGCRLCAWHLRPAQPRASVIYFHGSTANMGILNEIFSLFDRCSLQVLAFDYRGYGKSTGVPSEEGLYADGLAVARYFRTHLASGLPLIYWGRSLGTCVASFTAQQLAPDGLLLESAFPDKASLMKNYPYFRLFSPFSRCKLRTQKYLQGHSFPVLLVHGDRDRTVPLEQGQQLFAQLSGPKDLYRIAAADHVNLHRTQQQAYRQRVLTFVEELRSGTFPSGEGAHRLNQ